MWTSVFRNDDDDDDNNDAVPLCRNAKMNGLMKTQFSDYVFYMNSSTIHASKLWHQ